MQIEAETCVNTKKNKNWLQYPETYLPKRHTVLNNRISCEWLETGLSFRTLQKRSLKYLTAAVGYAKSVILLLDYLLEMMFFTDNRGVNTSEFPSRKLEVQTLDIVGQESQQCSDNREFWQISYLCHSAAFFFMIRSYHSLFAICLQFFPFPHSGLLPHCMTLTQYDIVRLFVIISVYVSTPKIYYIVLNNLTEKEVKNKVKNKPTKHRSTAMQKGYK